VQEYGEGEPSLKRRRDIAEDEEQPKPKKAKTGTSSFFLHALKRLQRNLSLSLAHTKVATRASLVRVTNNNT
jgi:hypothetical protein